MNVPAAGAPEIAVPKKPVKVLVVDDSAFMRFTISKHLEQHPAIKVCGSARDGLDALSLIPKLEPDVITLDVEMPRLDGLSTLKEIMAHYPRPVIMLSSRTREGAAETIQALMYGAVDFVTKPENRASVNLVIEDVIEKILTVSETKILQIPLRSPSILAKLTKPVKREISVRPLRRNDCVIVIGSSTGGPHALSVVLSGLPADLPAAVLIVQHMPAGFTRSLAERLNTLSHLEVKEAEPSDTLQAGKVLLAPGGFHMVVNKQGCIELNKNQPVHGVRPAIDVTMTSAVQQFGSAVVGVVLTGMGRDGTNGSALIQSTGGRVVAEDQSTCVVWGMPRSVEEAGFADQIAPLGDIASVIDAFAHQPNKGA